LSAEKLDESKLSLRLQNCLHPTKQNRRRAVFVTAPSKES
jgi:hypothetical protein